MLAEAAALGLAGPLNRIEVYDNSHNQGSNAVGAMIVAGPIAGRWTARVGPRVPMVLGCLLAGAGLLLTDHQLTVTTSVSDLIWPLAIAGLGFGIALVSVTQAVLTLVRPEESGMAASTVNTSRELGGVFGVAALGAVVNAVLAVAAGLARHVVCFRTVYEGSAQGTKGRAAVMPGGEGRGGYRAGGFMEWLLPFSAPSAATWIAMFADLFVRGALLLARFASGRWQRARV